MYPYYYYYGFSTAFTVMCVLVAVAVIAGIVIYFAFLREAKEEELTGKKAKIYHFFSFNKFHSPEIIKFLYIISAGAITAVGIVELFVNFIFGIIILILGNLVLRLVYELLMMFVILCKRTVSIDKRLDKISAFYGTDFDDECEVCVEEYDDECGCGEECACEEECECDEECICEEECQCGEECACEEESDTDLSEK